MVLLKRKRSDSDLSFSSGSALSPLPQLDGKSFNFSAMDTDHLPPSPTRSLRAPSHLPSRTMKRFRDNRPSDEEVHQHTLSLLYAAQHQQTSSQPPVAAPEPAAHLQPAAAHLQPAAAQRSLHSFWKIPAPAPAPAQLPPVASAALDSAVPTSCDDCGAELPAAMGVDSGDCSPGSSCCGACGRAVCFGCSVSNLGEQRRCLVCAGRRVWIGGVGWTNASGVGEAWSGGEILVWS